MSDCMRGTKSRYCGKLFVQRDVLPLKYSRQTPDIPILYTSGRTRSASSKTDEYNATPVLFPEYVVSEETLTEKVVVFRY